MLWRMPADLSPGRIGIMFARLDDLPAVPARDGATSPLTPGGISGPIYGVQKLPVADGRTRAMLFRAGALIGGALAEIAGIGANRLSFAKVAGRDLRRHAERVADRPVEMDQRRLVAAVDHLFGAARFETDLHALTQREVLLHPRADRDLAVVF